MRRYVFPGGTAVVTGAASGIGAALAAALAARGSNLVLVDRDAERLAGVAAALRAGGPALDVRTHVVDLADGAAVRGLGQTLLAERPGVTLLVNNAGIALAGRFDQVTLEEFDEVMNVNVRAAVILTHTLLPALKSRPGSHLVNVSSVFGLIAPPGQSAYAASKYALRGLTESLRHELAGDGIGVTVVHPGGVRTRIAATARVGSGVPPAEAAAGKAEFERLLTIDPATAAAVILEAVERRRGRVLIGWTAVLSDVLARLAPSSYGRVFAVVVRVVAAVTRAGRARRLAGR